MHLLPLIIIMLFQRLHSFEWALLVATKPSALLCTGRPIQGPFQLSFLLNFLPQYLQLTTLPEMPTSNPYLTHTARASVG